MRILLLLLLALATVATSFVPTPSFTSRPSSAHFDGANAIELSSSEQQIYDFLQELHTSGYPFRTIVSGNGAILESTQRLGPTLKVGESGKTGDLILTMASEDQSFEFHVKIQQVHKIVLVEREVPGKTIRIIRMTNAEEQSMCSLILGEYSDEAAAFFQGLVTKYGSEFQPK